MSERAKTIILTILIIVAVVFILYMRGGYEQNFIDTLR
jgi:hypothetical protein